MVLFEFLVLDLDLSELLLIEIYSALQLRLSMLKLPLQGVDLFLIVSRNLFQIPLDALIFLNNMV